MRLSGCRRDDGRVGARNHVVILPLDDLPNAAAEGAATAMMQDAETSELTGDEQPMAARCASPAVREALPRTYTAYEEKALGNIHTVGTMGEHIDVDRTGLLAGEIGLEEAASLVLETFERTTRGRLTAAEVLGHREFVLTKPHRSA